MSNTKPCTEKHKLLEGWLTPSDCGTCPWSSVSSQYVTYLGSAKSGKLAPSISAPCEQKGAQEAIAVLVLRVDPEEHLLVFPSVPAAFRLSACQISPKPAIKGVDPKGLRKPSREAYGILTEGLGNKGMQRRLRSPDVDHALQWACPQNTVVGFSRTVNRPKLIRSWGLPESSSAVALWGSRC